MTNPMDDQMGDEKFGPYTANQQREAIKQFREAEREACGRVADRMAPYTGTAAAIRARSQA